MAFTYAGLYSDPALGPTGPLTNTTVTVYLAGTTTLATLYTSRTKATTAANPVTTDAYGNLVFYADPGRYDLLCNGVTVAVTVGIDAEEAAQDSEVTAAVDAHAGDADPHAAYQLESEKDQPNGYPGLSAAGFVVPGQLGSGTRDGTKFLRDDGTWQAVSGGAGGAPTDATYIVLSANATLTSEKVLSTDVIMAGTLAGRPAASADNAGALYFATDDDGGTLTRSNGASWANVAGGLTEAPPQHGFSRHGPGGADSWTQLTRRTTNHAGVINSTTLVDSGLSIVGAANEVWAFDARIFYTASTTGDIRAGWSVPSGVTGQWGAHALVASAASNPADVNVKATDYTGTVASGGSGTAELMVVLSGIMAFGATPGTSALQIAQNALDATTATIVLAHSHLLATRVA